MARKLPKRDLEFFRKLLEERRRLATGDIESLSGSGRQEAVSGDSADRGTDASEQVYLLSLIESGTNVVREIDDALERIEDGTYGICEVNGTRIDKERLKAIPWTKLSIEAQRQIEESQRFGYSA